MPHDTASGGPITTFAGFAVASRLPSSIPVLVVPDDVVTGSVGPVPVAVEHGERSVLAWAWPERAWDRVGTPSAPDAERTFSLSRLAAERLAITDRLGQKRCPLTVRIPVPVPVAPVLPLVHDPPASDEVQVPLALQGFCGRAVLLRNGVAASVAVVARDHVRPGTVRVSRHLLSITGPAATSRTGNGDTVLLHLPQLGPNVRSRDIGFLRQWASSVRTRFQTSTERTLRWFFRAEEQAMRVVYAHPYDEHQFAVSMTDAALLRLGIRAGDKAVLNWLGTETEVTVLQDHEPVEPQGDEHAELHDPTKPGPARDMSPHLAVRVPTALRYVTNLPAASIVTMRRSTRSVLARNLNNLIIPVASLALAGAALNNPNWWFLGIGAVATALLGLSRLRMSSRRAIPLGRDR